ILVVGTGASVVLSGDWQLAPSFFALGAVSLCASAAVSSVVSVLLPYPATRPDESPFLQPQWQGFGSGFAQTVSLLATVALIAPVIWFVVFNSVTTSLKEQATFVGASLGYGLILLLLGVSVGGMIYKKKASDILNLMQVFD
ncbi:MAG TPA: hypothetical protein VLZ31_01695, partial [Microbacteriaceae bacterium]|nr:hypothetical protein [Microbacteriaceae bacterium]